MHLDRIEDLNITQFQPLLPPQALKEALPVSEEMGQTVLEARTTIQRILQREDRRMIVVAGPCSIHDHEGAIEYAQRLAKLSALLQDKLFVVMRTYFAKPRTSIGWKGLINDPRLDGSYDIEAGLRAARQLLVEIARMRLPAATEMLDAIMPQYLADLVSWGSIGARTVESQVHRELSSGLSMPIGFKNSTDGHPDLAIHAILAARHPHHFVGIDEGGRTCTVSTKGNLNGHLILRGGNESPNYDPVSVARALEKLRAAKLEPNVMIDCSHGNSGKRYELQEHVLKDVAQQRLAGNTGIIGLMLESFLHEGAQKIPADLSELKYGISVTDACIGWEKTEALLHHLYEMLPDTK